MNIDQIFAQTQTAGDKLITGLNIPKSWSQGRTVFGGVSAALLYQAIRNKIDVSRVLRSMTTHFIGPLNAEQDFSISIDILREGKNTAVVEARAIQDNQVCVLVTTCFGLARDSKIEVPSIDKHDLRPPKKGNFLMKIPKLAPAFLKHIELDIVEGSLPFLGSKKSNYCGWMRFRKAPDSITDAHLIALIDAWPPSVLQMVKGPAPASTLSWNLEFIHPHSPIGPEDWFAYSSTTKQAGDGYAHSEANIWDVQGDLVAVSRQVGKSVV